MRSGRSGRPTTEPIVSWPAVATLIAGAALAVVELRRPGYSVAGVAAMVAFTWFVVLVLCRWWRWFVHRCDR
jgi:membrane-bound ClpP family serine protease